MDVTDREPRIFTEDCVHKSSEHAEGGRNITLGWKHVIKRLGMSRLSERPGHTTLTKGQYNQGQAEEAQVQHLREGRKKHCAEGWVRGHPS